MTFDLHNGIIVYNLKTKHQRCMKLYICGNLMTRRTISHYFQRHRSMFQSLTQVEFSRSMAAILEMSQYVAYLKNVAYALLPLSTKSWTICGISENVVYAVIKLSAKSHNCNILCTMDVLSCPTTRRVSISN